MESLIENVPMPAASATQLDRLRFLVNVSHRSQAQFSRLIGLDPSSLSRLLSGRMPITDQFVNRIVVNLGVSKKWFTHGEGVPFPRSEQPIATADEAKATAPGTMPKGAPVYDIDATAGVSLNDRMFASDSIVGYLDLPHISPTNPVIRVQGDSMEPRLRNGSWISVREIHDPSIILWGNIYLVITDDYRVVKSVRRHPSDADKLVLHSINPAYDDIEIDRKSVRKLFLVESVIDCVTLI